MLTIHRKRSFCLGILLFLATGCSLFKSEPTITPIIPVTAEISVPIQPDDLEYGKCPFEEPSDMSSDEMPEVHCANLTVPKDWQVPNGPKLKLAVAIIKTRSDNPKRDPLLVLIGNPGYGLYITYVLPYIFENIIKQRDLIIVDLRGTGFSDPSYNCPELLNLSTGVRVNLSLEQVNEQLVEASRACAVKIKTSADDLSDYTTAAEAADLEYLRQIMGINQWNIFSIIDGSRLAFTMMREYPQSIRSVIMDSPVPLQVNPTSEWGITVVDSLDRLFKSCADDARCHEAYPNLKDTFYALLKQLDAEPVIIDVANQNGDRYRLILDDEKMITILLILLNTVNDRGSLPEAPRMIYQLREGNITAAEVILEQLAEDTMPETAMDFWQDCNEELSFTNLDKVKQANANLDPYIRQYFNASAEGSLLACEEWKAPGVSEIENMPVASGIPTLLLSGEYDWAQPPAWAELAAKTLRSSTLVNFAGIGQIVYGSEHWSLCTHQIVDDFLDAPDSKPDTSCASVPYKITWITLP